MAGRPRGAWANKAWRDALRVAVLRSPDEDIEPKTNLDELVQKLVAAGKTGDITALKEIGDRLDGKPAQALIGGDEDDPAIRTITEIRRSIVDVRNPDSQGI